MPAEHLCHDPQQKCNTLVRRSDRYSQATMEYGSECHEASATPFLHAIARCHCMNSLRKGQLPDFLSKSKENAKFISKQKFGEPLKKKCNRFLLSVYSSSMLVSKPEHCYNAKKPKKAPNEEGTFDFLEPLFTQSNPHVCHVHARTPTSACTGCLSHLSDL